MSSSGGSLTATSPRLSDFVTVSVEVVVFGLISALVVTLLSGSRSVVCRLGDDPVDIAKMTVVKYANEAFPQWSRAHPDERCPPDLAALTVYMDSNNTRDPWGHAYELRCPARTGIAVISAGEDGVRGTDDDITSDVWPVSRSNQ